MEMTNRADKGRILRDGLLGLALVCCVLSVVLCAIAMCQTQTMIDGLKLDQETREDDVRIATTYVIRSTLPLSTAYQTGDMSGLSAAQKSTLEMASAVLREITTEDMSAYEREKAVYDWMCEHIGHGEDAGVAIPEAGTGYDDPYQVLRGGKAVCVGFATTFRLFMQMQGIECKVVHDTEAEHSWDLVKLDGDWYHVDVFSDAGSGNYHHFNANDQQMKQGYMTWDESYFPAANGTRYNCAVQNAVPLADIYEIPAEIAEALQKKQGLLAYRFETLGERDEAVIERMLSSVYERVSPRDIYGYGGYDDEYEESPTVDWTWMKADGTARILAIYLNAPDDADSREISLTEAEETKIKNAVDGAFGAEEPDEDQSYE